MHRVRQAAGAAALAFAALLASACAPLLVTTAAVGTLAGLDRRTVGAQIDDQSLQVRANQQIKAVLDGSETAYANANAFNRRLLLTGLAPDEASKERAGRIARGLEGVREVYNEIQVGRAGGVPGSASDTKVTAQVKAALARLDDPEPNAVKVVTEHGVVYLLGLVTEGEAARATETVRKVSGVRKVVTLFEHISEQTLAELRRDRAKPAPSSSQ